jgi:hypothetical protein
VTTVNASSRLASGREAARAKRVWVLIGGLAIAVAGSYAATLVATEGEPLLVAPLVGALVGLAVFTRPELGLYLLFVAAILLEQFEITGLSPLTARTNFFQNISGFSDVPLRFSACDLVAVMTLASWSLRRVVGANAPARVGPLKWGLAAYGLAFAFGGVIGASRGGSGDAIAALAEARGPIYALLICFLTANLVRERRHVLVLLWIFVVLVGVKAFQAIGNYVEVMTRGPFWIEAVTAHEDVIFFDVAIALALVMVALGLRGRLIYVLLALQPVILAAEVLTTRRVAFAALAAALLVVALMSVVDRPRVTMLVVAAGTLAFAFYVAAMWDHRGPGSLPVSVIRQVVDPNSLSARDRGSNDWREIENANIAYTVRQLPLTGVGLGQEYLFQREPPPLTNFVYWRLMTHNAVLWLWLKAGPYGAFALWFLVGQVLLWGLRLYRRLGDPVLRAAASFPVLLTAAQVVFSSVDLGLTYNRTMIVFGVALGLVAPLSAWVRSERPERNRFSSKLATKEAPRGDGAPRGFPAPLGGQVPTGST